MPTIAFTSRCKAAAIAAGMVLALALLAMSTGTLLVSQRVKAESGGQLVRLAEQVAKRLEHGLSPALAAQLTAEMATRPGQLALFVSNPAGQLLLASQGGGKAPELPDQAGWQIKRWPDGQVYLSAAAQVAGRQWTVRIRQPLNIALAEVQDLQWTIFLRALPAAALAALLGGALAGRWPRRAAIRKH